MNVNLGPVFDNFIAELIKSGTYQSQSQVVREGLRLLKEREEMKKGSVLTPRAKQDILFGLFVP